MTSTRPTIVYLHGASVRDVAPVQWRIRAGLERAGLGHVDIIALRWAEASGPSTPSIADLMPEPTLGTGPLELETVAGARASAVPVAELRKGLLAEAARFESEEPQAADIAAAVRTVARSGELRRVAASSSRHDPGLPAVIRELVRAEVATSVPNAMAERPSLVSSLLCAIVERIAAVGSEGGEWCPTLAGGDLPRWVTGELRHCRPRLMQPSVAALTDIFHYLRHGDEARALVRRTIQALPGPVLVIGESLGGIVAADVLAIDPPGHVRGLVTVGSQVAVLHAMDALDSLRPGEGHSPFTPWLNVYSEYDFASFLAGPGWPDVGDIEDVEVDDGVTGFPESHSRYWHTDATFTAIADFAGRVWTA
jgi:pimeloyl-ACP methyl ester carboxylesterase